MIFVYCPRNSDGATQLVAKAQEQGGSVRRIKRRMPKVTSADVVVNWGCRQLDSRLNKAARVLNSALPPNKVWEATRLAALGVRFPSISSQPKAGYLARSAFHHEANDLLRGASVGDYYVKRLVFANEFRCHVWEGKVFRSGIKRPRLDEHHEWIRSWNAGWKLDYGSWCQERITSAVRGAAKAAVAALKLDFGAVDVGVDREGIEWVLEVNTAPGLEGETVTRYAERIVAL